MQLFFREFGKNGVSVVILHGFLGSSDNWITQAKMLSEKYHLYLPDQRNHGQSPHSKTFDLETLSDDLKNFIEQNKIKNPIIIGHSMGGKVAMKFACQNEHLLQKLVIVDIGPKPYPIHHDKILTGLKAIPVDTLQSRQEADTMLSDYVEDPGVRQFLLKNLSRKAEGGFSWKMNLPVLEQKIDTIGEQINPDSRFNKATLFIRGEHSNYIVPEDYDLIQKIFPKAKIITLKTGHWVQAEDPKGFVDEIIRFVK